MKDTTQEKKLRDLLRRFHEHVSTCTAQWGDNSLGHPIWAEVEEAIRLRDYDVTLTIRVRDYSPGDAVAGLLDMLREQDQGWLVGDDAKIVSVEPVEEP